MSVVGIANELPDSPKGTFDKDKVAFTRKFLVKTNDYNDGPFVACSAIGIPPYYSSYATANETFPLAYAKKYDAERLTKNSLNWVVTVSYETLSDEQQDQHQDPRLDQPEVTVTFENYQVPVTSSDDDDDTPIMNSASDPFDPPPTMDKSRMVLTIKRNEDISAPHPAIGLAYVNSINSDSFWGGDPYTWKCQGISTSFKARTLPSGQWIPYLEVQYVFHYHEDTWDLTLLDAGPNYLDDPGGAGGIQKIAFKTKDGHPYIGLLDGSTGAKSPDGLGHYLAPIRIYTPLPFSALGLPQSYSQVIPTPGA